MIEKSEYLQSFHPIDVCAWIMSLLDQNFDGYVKLECRRGAIKNVFLLDMKVKIGDKVPHR